MAELLFRGREPHGFLPILRPGAHSKLTAVLLSHQVEAFWVHWPGDRDRLCLKEIGMVCTRCIEGMPRRYYLFSLALDWEEKKVGIVQITEDAWFGCPDLHQVATKCRGVVVELARPGPKNGRVTARVLPRRATEEQMPRLYGSPRCRLFRMWGVDADLDDKLREDEEAAMTSPAPGPSATATLIPDVIDLADQDQQTPADLADQVKRARNLDVARIRNMVHQLRNGVGSTPADH